MVALITGGAFDAASPSSPAFAPSPSAARDINVPTQLCRWSLHVSFVDYEHIPEDANDSQDGVDELDPASWTEWPLQELEDPSKSFTRSMEEAIVSGTFSLTPPDGLPISTELISQSVRQDPEALEVDAWRVAIMAGNVDLVLSMKKPPKIDEISPFHLAASFLDGGNSCCSMIAALFSVLGSQYLFFHDRDQLGHTVLDTLMIGILRSHTSIAPEHVSSRFNPPHRFPGEEKDICGRWDADSPAVRALFRHGYARVPARWKHVFCHTAAQAICHSAIAVLGSPASHPIDTLSGLFIRRCTECGLELRMGPLHTLVVVAFYLAHRGMPGETLFGALALLVCLLSLGADASLKVVLSVDAILENAEPGGCRHKPMDASDLMQAVPCGLVGSWSADCQTGWACILQVLRLCKRGGDSNSERESDRDSDVDMESEKDQSMGDFDAGREGESDGNSESEDCPLGFYRFDISAHKEWLRLPCGTPKLGLLWATIQVELLTYRRIGLADPWVSSRFLMGALRMWLEGGSSEFCTPLVQEGLMREHTRCGWFTYARDFMIPVAEEVCDRYFMNMDVYDRASFLEGPGLGGLWLEVEYRKDKV